MIFSSDRDQTVVAVRLPLAFDPAPLANYLDELAGSEWTDHFVRQHYRGDWSVVPLRAPKGAMHPILRITAPPGAQWEDTELLVDSPFRALLQTFRCQIDSARLMRLGPGSEILEHCDPDLDDASGSLRLHLPIRTNPDVVFEVARQRVVMPAGTLWYLRLSEPHRVANHGVVDRIHLVLDVIRNAWIDDLLTRGEQRHALPITPLS